MELLITRNPDPDSALPYLLRVPLGAGLLFRVKDTWPRTNAVYCHPVDLADWPESPEVVERVPLRSCARRGAAIDIVADRAREHRSQLVFTRGRGREMVFWQSPRTRKQARPDVSLPSSRAAGIADVEIVVDARERYPYTFRGRQVSTVKQGLPCGDYAVTRNGQVVAAVERKTLNDLLSSLSSGRLRFALTELATLPRAAVVVEDRYSQIFRAEHIRPTQAADGLAELQVRWSTVPLVFCDNRKLAEEWTYRYRAAASAWGETEAAATARIGVTDSELTGDAPRPVPSTRQLRAWARAQGIAVSSSGRLSPEIRKAWDQAGC